MVRVPGGNIVPLENKTKYRCMKWQLRVPVGKDPRTGKYSPRCRTFYGTWAEAQEAHTKFMREVARSTRSTKITPTVEELAEEYVKHREELGKVESTTAKTMRTKLTALSRHLGAARCDQVSVVAVEDAVKHMMAGDTATGRPMSGATARMCVSAAIGMYDYAVTRGYAPENPIRSVELPPDDGKEKRALTDDEVVKLLEIAAPDRRWALVMLCLLAGLRQGEACELHWADVDLIGATITVRGSMTTRGESKATKTATSAATVPIMPTLVEYLLAWKEEQAAQMDAHGLEQSEDGRVGDDDAGFRTTPAMFSTWWKKMRGKICMDDITLHQLRHTYSTMLAHAGADPKAMQNLMRHASSATTLDVYTHANLDSQRVAVDKLERKLRVNIRT